jgi:chaperone modulatory protein CbpM
MNFISIEDAYDKCGVKKEIIVHFIEEEWIHPADQEHYGLDEEDLARIRLIRELKDEFGVNDEGLSIILNLIDQLNRMHLEIGKLHFENN